MTAPANAPTTDRLRRAGWLLLWLTLIPASVAQWRSHERLLQPSVHEPVPPDWVRYDAAREFLHDIELVHIYSDIETRLLLLRRFDLQFSALPAVLWAHPPGRNPTAPPNDRTAFLIDARTPTKANSFTAAIRQAAKLEGYRTEVHPVTTKLRVLRFVDKATEP